ncbi:MAG: CBS domain-containing protein [Gemmatimonadetes bacterium]|nr:CBS domain-containing protein [Gemmatimonadota bacterium]
MRVADIMQTELQVIAATDIIEAAVAVLADHHVSGLPVVDDEGRFVGVISNSDILEALAEHNEPTERERIFTKMEVRELMTPRPQTIGPDASIRDAAQRMLYLEVHRLFVESQGRLVGVVSTTDLVRTLAAAKV